MYIKVWVWSLVETDERFWPFLRTKMPRRRACFNSSTSSDNRTPTSAEGASRAAWWMLIKRFLRISLFLNILNTIACILTSLKYQHIFLWVLHCWTSWRVSPRVFKIAPEGELQYISNHKHHYRVNFCVLISAFTFFFQATL